MKAINYHVQQIYVADADIFFGRIQTKSRIRIRTLWNSDQNLVEKNVRFRKTAKVHIIESILELSFPNFYRLYFLILKRWQDLCTCLSAC